MYFANSFRATVSSRWAETGRDKIAPLPVEHEKVCSSGLQGISDKGDPVNMELNYPDACIPDAIETPLERR